MSETKKRWIIGAIAAAVIVALYYYLRSDNGSQLVTYPNTQASGVPASKNAATYNISVPSPAPSPGLVYNPPALPATPGFMIYNNAPVDIVGPTTYNVAALPDTPGCNGGSCGDCCGCSSCPSGGVYVDGNKQTCLAPSPAAPPISPRNPVVIATSAAISSFFGTNAAPIVPGGPTA